MAEANGGAGPELQQSWADPKAAPGSEEPWMVHTPVWHVVIRGFQIFFAFVIVVMAGVLIHGNSMDANAFALVCVRMNLVRTRAQGNGKYSFPPCELSAKPLDL